MARVLGPHAVRGELKCAVLTSFPRRFATTERVYLGPARQPFAVRRARIQGQFVLLLLEGIDTREAAERWRNAVVAIPHRERIHLPSGHYFWDEVIGLAVSTDDGQPLGRVVDILETGANDVYVVRSEQGELLVPAIAEVVKRIDPARGEMIVHLIDGLR